MPSHPGMDDLANKNEAFLSNEKMNMGQRKKTQTDSQYKKIM